MVEIEQSVVDQVLRDLSGLCGVGVHVDSKVFDYVRGHPAEMAEYRRNGMRISEIADLSIQLAGVQSC